MPISHPLYDPLMFKSCYTQAALIPADLQLTLSPIQSASRVGYTLFSAAYLESKAGATGGACAMVSGSILIENPLVFRRSYFSKTTKLCPEY